MKTFDQLFSDENRDFNAAQASASSRRKFLGQLGCLAGTALLAGCGKGDSKEQGAAGSAPKSGRLKIVTTCGMVTDIVKAVIGEEPADVTGLLGEGVDPHLYQPGRNDVQELQSADVVFYSGLMLEGGMQRVLEQAASKRPVFAVTDAIEKSYLRTPEEFEGHPDPHVWMDVSAWNRCVGFIGEKMAEIDAAHASAYRKNAETYQKQLTELDEYVKKVVATIPKSQRYLVTAHDAFGYFARAYELEVKSVQGISTQSEAAVADVNELVSFVVEHKIPALFVESSVPAKNIQAVKEGCQSKSWTVSIGGSLFSDAMGAPGTYEGTYIGMLDHNATRIAQALGGEAPERGWQGKLAGTTAETAKEMK